MRIIEQLGDFWRKLMDKLDDLEIQQQLDKAYQRFCGLDRDMAERLDVASLQKLLEEPQRVALAEITWLRAEAGAEQLNPEDTQVMYLRALALLAATESREVAQASVVRTETLLAATGDGLPTADGIAVLRLLTLAGAYDKAEDLLFAQLELWPKGKAPADLLAAGEVFYAELAKKTEEALFAGGFSRAEVAEGEAALRAWRRADGGPSA